MKTLLTTAAIVTFATQAFAENYATITNVTPNYQEVTTNAPVTICNDVEVPIYGNTGGGASGADVLGGMIIGGLLGKGVTGKDNGAAAGAVLGGIIAADKGNQNRQVITGYRIERQCSNVMVNQQQREIKNYTITYYWNGITAQSYTFNQYRVGDKIPVTVSINAQ